MKSNRFAYMTEDGLRPHELRDGDAYAALQPALIELGYEDGATFINHPVRKDAPDTSLNDMGLLSDKDLLVITSRPPIHESNLSYSRQVRASHPSGNLFEQQVLFPMFEKYLLFCTRNQIILRPGQAERLEAGYKNRADLSFFVKPNAKKNRFESAYSIAGGGGRFLPFMSDRTTAAYLIHTDPLEMPDGKKGARVLAAFGVSGTIGLVFAHHLRHQKHPAFVGLLEDALKQPGLSMMEITVTKDVPSFYTSLDFSDQWGYKLITRRNGLQGGSV